MPLGMISTYMWRKHSKELELTVLGSNMVRNGACLNSQTGKPHDSQGIGL